jgi:hypothetical protein
VVQNSLGIESRALQGLEPGRRRWRADRGDRHVGEVERTEQLLFGRLRHVEHRRETTMRAHGIRTLKATRVPALNATLCRACRSRRPGKEPHWAATRRITTVFVDWVAARLAIADADERRARSAMLLATLRAAPAQCTLLDFSGRCPAAAPAARFRGARPLPPPRPTAPPFGPG